MKPETEKYILKEFERQSNLIHRNQRLIDDNKIVENLAFGLLVQKSKILEVLKKFSFKID